uniref:Uncharacterized protein n=1 Tax=Physcomitrium patens TaxID=3218 RepID=A0A2K1JH52_PHYPA|nr:hypothetical protein PHYPA_018286 [Physcomitrium patens]
MVQFKTNIQKIRCIGLRFVLFLSLVSYAPNLRELRRVRFSVLGPYNDVPEIDTAVCLRFLYVETSTYATVDLVVDGK